MWKCTACKIRATSSIPVFSDIRVSKCSVRDSDQLVVLDEVEEDFDDEDYEDIDEHDEL